MSDEGYLTTAEAIAYLRTTPRTLYRHLSTGQLPAVRVGHQWRFRKGDLDQWLDTRSPRATATDNTALSVTTGRRRRVLIVDDEPSICDLLVMILGVMELDIERVVDGATAVERLRACPWDLLLTDLKMPTMEGTDVAREAKRLQPRIKVVIVTGHPSQSSAIDAINIGVDGYITKPFRPMDVLMATARALDLGPMPGQPRGADHMVTVSSTEERT